MPLSDILTNRNQLSEDILSGVADAAAGYGVAISRADVKDLVFPGNLQEIMNRVLATERLSEAALVESRTNAEQGRIESAARAETEQFEAQARRDAALLTAQADAEAMRIRADADVDALRRRADAARPTPGTRHCCGCASSTVSALRANAGARLYIDFDRGATPEA